MRLLLGLTAVVALAGCGADVEGQITDFPDAKVVAGRAVAKVDSAKDAKAYCDAAQASWPKAYAGYPYVTFDVPKTTNDFSCVRPTG